MYIATRLHTYFFGKYVGSDEYGNKYFRSARNKNKKERRWVIYKGIVEASKIPVKWHMWLHYTTDDLPFNSQSERYSWQKEHAPNYTLTKRAYSPRFSKRRDDRPYFRWNPQQG